MRRLLTVTPLGGGFFWVLLALAGCFGPVDLTGAPCPCGQPYECCEFTNTCIEAGASCPGRVGGRCPCDSTGQCCAAVDRCFDPAVDSCVGTCATGGSVGASWHLDEGPWQQGSAVTDSAFGRHGVATGVVSAAAEGILGGGARFDTSDDGAIELPQAAGGGTGPITLGLWFYADSNLTSPAVLLGNGNLNVTVTPTGSQLEVQFSVGSAVAVSTISLFKERWISVIATLNGTTIRLFINGALSDEQTGAPPLALTTVTCVGAAAAPDACDPASMRFVGMIDEIFASNVATAYFPVPDNLVVCSYNDGDGRQVE